MNEPGEQLVLAPAEAALPLAVPKPRIWTVLVATFVGFPAYAVASGVVFVALVVIGIAVGKFDTDVLEQPLDAHLQLALIPGMIVILFLPHLAMGLTPLVIARLSRQSVTQRLGLTRSRLPAWSLFALVPGTWFTGALAYLLFPDLMKDPGEAMELALRMTRESSTLAFIFIFAVVSLQAGIIEEIFFRGYVQRRLLQRWKPVWAITFSSVGFVLFHLDPGQMAAILPMAFWLGIVAWRAGSIIPAIICHAANNAHSILMMRWASEETLMSSQWDVASIIQMMVFAVGFGVSVYLLWRYGSSDPPVPASIDVAATSSRASPSAPAPVLPAVSDLPPPDDRPAPPPPSA